MVLKFIRVTINFNYKNNDRKDSIYILQYIGGSFVSYYIYCVNRARLVTQHEISYKNNQCRRFPLFMLWDRGDIIGQFFPWMISLEFHNSAGWAGRYANTVHFQPSASKYIFFCMYSTFARIELLLLL